MFKAITNILRSTASKVYKQAPAQPQPEEEDPYAGLYDSPEGYAPEEEQLDPADSPVFRAVGSTFWYTLPQLWSDFDDFGLYELDDLGQKTPLSNLEDVESGIRLAEVRDEICFGAFYQGRFVRFVQ